MYDEEKGLNLPMISLVWALKQAKDQFLDSELADLLKPGSWEEDLVSVVHSSIAISFRNRDHNLLTLS